jgi:hypothetical protein
MLTVAAVLLLGGLTVVPLAGRPLGPPVLSTSSHPPPHAVPVRSVAFETRPDLVPSFVGPGHRPLRPPLLRGPSGRAVSVAPGIPLPKWCYGVAPPTGQNDLYYSSCYGHDEPGIDFYSNLPGSGGNVSWNVSLPIDANATQNQSDLYAAIWFGLTLTDPLGWMDQCFLELQLFPDSSWTSSSTVPGHWAALAVAWQIDAVTGYEDPCYYSPVFVGGNPNLGYLDMLQGDQVTVTMTGWPGSAAGESIVLDDLTSGTTASLTLVDPVNQVPLDPAYTVNSWPGSLQWTPGGELPVAFAFEVGHAGNPSYPQNSSYGGCSPGVPPATPSDGAVPCPSYDPASWANDTAQPWEIQPPTFFNAASRQRPAQVAFTQDFGGINAISSLSNGTCTGRIGSSYCSYPWYSYSCSAHAFEFGALDYPGVTRDFGQYNEYSSSNVSNGLGLGYYPPANYSVPSCTSPNGTLSVAVSGAGQAVFLGNHVDNSTVFPSLIPGAYALDALPGVGESFRGWTVTGAASVDLPMSPEATVTLSGTGNVTAEFGNAPGTSTIWFNDSASNGTLELYQGGLAGPGSAIAVLTPGSSEALAPGLYSVQSYNPPGSNFTGYTAVGPAVRIATASFPFTPFLVVTTGATGSIESTSAVAVDAAAYVSAEVVGKGTLRVAPAQAPSRADSTNSTANWTLPVGSYEVEAIPSPGWAFMGWSGFGSMVQSDFRNLTNLSLEAGSTSLIASFGAQVRVIIASPGAGRARVANSPPLANDSVVQLAPGAYSIDALPFAGDSFVRWSVSDSAALWVGTSASAHPRLTVNASATLTAIFTAAFSHTVSFAIAPAGAGSIRFNDLSVYTANTSSPATNDSVANGTFLLATQPSSGYRFIGWSFTGGLAEVSGYLVVSGSGSAVARFATQTYPITFVSSPAGSALATINGTVLASGGSVSLAKGSYPLVVLPSGNLTFLAWSSNLQVSSLRANHTNLVVSGPGTVTAVVAPFGLSAVEVPYSSIDLGVSQTLSIHVIGVGTYHYRWSGLPSGCVPIDAPSLRCAATGAGNFSVRARVTNAEGISVLSAPRTVTVVPRPGLSGLRASPQAEVGSPLSLSASESGGTAPLSFTYYGLPAGCVSVDGPVLTCRPSAAGIFEITLNVTDSFSMGTESSVAVDIAPLPLVLSFQASRATLTAGATTVLTTAVEGGTAPFTYSYLGLPTGCTGASTDEVVCAPTGPGTFGVGVEVTDSLHHSSNASLELVVNPAPTIGSFSIQPTLVVLGESAFLNLSISGGTGPLRVAYAGLPPGCLSENTTRLECVSNTTGTFTVTAQVSDADGSMANSTQQLIVAPPTVPARPAGAAASPSYFWLEVGIAVVVGIELGVISIVVRRLRRPPTRGTTPAV